MDNLILPELGEGITSVEISDILVNDGDVIKVDDPIIIVETEKASMEIPTMKAGTVEKIFVKIGKSISPGDAIISITGSVTSDELAKTPSTSDTESTNSKNIVKIEFPKSAIKTENPTLRTIQPTILDLGQPVLASPSVRRFARELGCNLNLVSGTGPKGRITQKDVQRHIKDILAGTPVKNHNFSNTAQGQDLDFAKFGEVEIIPLNKIKKITGERIQQSWQTIPHVTQFDQCDITKLEKVRKNFKKTTKQKEAKVSLLPFFIKAVEILLGEMPQFNSSLDKTNQNLVLKKYINIGVAIETPSGLVVPVIKNISNKSIIELDKELTNISKKAREKKLSLDDMQGGCFTISSLGGIGGTYFTPIINPPEVAILGISRSSYKQIFFEGKFLPQLILPFSLSYDHRVIDGADAARFTTHFGQLLSNLENIT